MGFASNLRNLRTSAGISAKDFSIKLGIPYPTYAAYENEKTAREPKYSMLCKIARALHTSPNVLLGFDESPPDPYMNSIRTVAVAAAEATANKLGFSIKTSDDTDDARFEELSRLMAEAGFAIKIDHDSPPDPKFGPRVVITVNDWGCKNTTFDYFYRMYLLIFRIWQGELHSAYADFKGKLLIRYGGRKRFGDLLDENEALLDYYERLFELKIAPKSADEIKAIAEGKAENPLVNKITA